MKKLKTIIITLLMLAVICQSEAQTYNNVLVEIFGAKGCEPCELALEAANNLPDSAAIVYWSEDQEGETIMRDRRRYYFISSYPTTWFAGKEHIIGGLDGSSSIQKKFDEYYLRASTETITDCYITIEKVKEIEVILYGSIGKVFFIAKNDLSTHRPSFIHTFNIDAGFNHYTYYPQPGDKEFIVWVEDRSGVLNCQKFTYDATGIENLLIEDPEITLQDGFIYPNSDYMIIKDVLGRKLTESFDNKPVSLNSLPEGFLICVTRNSYLKIWR